MKRVSFLLVLLFNWTVSQLVPGNTNPCDTNDVPYKDILTNDYRLCASNAGCPTGYYCTTGYCCPQPGGTCPGNVQPMMSSVNNRPLPCSTAVLCPVSHYCTNGVCCPTQRSRCTEPKAVGNCKQYVRRFWYNSQDRACEEFIFSGCQGNNNNFPSLADCLSYCRGQIGGPLPIQIQYPNIINLGYGLCPAGDTLRTLTGQEIPCATAADCKAPQTHICYNRRCCPNRVYACSLAKDPGYCNNLVPRYYFDSGVRACLPFTWKGCGGNPNRFTTASDCENYCINNIVPQNIQYGIRPNSVQLPIVQAVFPSSCEIGYPQRDGNGNAVSCSSVNMCNNQTHACINGWCCPRTDYVCTQPMVAGSCSLFITRWWHNSIAARCDSFIYTGCNGNDNSFSSQSECEAFCRGGPISNGVVSNSILINNNIIFATPQPGTSAGRCPGNDELNLHRVCVSDGDCTVAIENCYGGICCARRDVLCGFPKQVGTCTTQTERWWFNRHDGRCQSFMYSGCFGNANNFRSRSECENFCRNAQPIPV